MHRSGRSIALLALLSSGCPSEPVWAPPPFATVPLVAPPPPPDQTELALRIVSEECARLIGSINAGIEMVDKMGGTGTGDQQFERSATALEAIARAIESSVYRTPDLQRLAGFYVGVAKAQATLVREIGVALDKGDEATLSKAEGKLQTLGNMEDTVVSELNLRCRGIQAETPPTPGPPVVSGPR
jgi:hypothetical protein